MQVVLVMFRGDGERRSFSVVRDVTVLGRREDCDLRIPLSDISRKHCRIIRSQDSVRIEDLGSSNGTLCNGERVTSIELQAGDTLTVGPVSFVVQIDGVPADHELSPYGHQATEASPQDTAAAAAAVGVGILQEVDPADGPLEELEELEEVEDLDLGAAPLIASADDGDVAGMLDELEALPQAGAATDDSMVLEELEPAEELEPVDQGATVAARNGSASAQGEGPLEPMEELAHLDEPNGEPTVPPAPVRAAAPVPPAAPRSRSSVPAAPAAPVAPAAAPHEPLEGELQSSDEFEALSEQSAFDIVMDDDAAQNSATGEIEIDWSTESKP